jgi:hypothetical protein
MALRSPAGVRGGGVLPAVRPPPRDPRPSTLVQCLEIQLPRDPASLRRPPGLRFRVWGRGRRLYSRKPGRSNWAVRERARPRVSGACPSIASNNCSVYMVHGAPPPPIAPGTNLSPSPPPSLPPSPLLPPSPPELILAPPPPSLPVLILAPPSFLRPPVSIGRLGPAGDAVHRDEGPARGRRCAALRGVHHAELRPPTLTRCKKVPVPLSAPLRAGLGRTCPGRDPSIRILSHAAGKGWGSLAHTPAIQRTTCSERRWASTSRLVEVE